MPCHPHPSSVTLLQVWHSKPILNILQKLPMTLWIMFSLIAYQTHYLAVTYLALTSPCCPLYTLVTLNRSYFLNSYHDSLLSPQQFMLFPLQGPHDLILISTTPGITPNILLFIFIHSGYSWRSLP